MPILRAAFKTMVLTPVVDASGEISGKVKLDPGQESNPLPVAVYVIYFKAVAVFCFPTLDSSQHPLCSHRTPAVSLCAHWIVMSFLSIGEQPLANYYQKGVHR